MAKSNSFDIACNVDMNEVKNAVNQATREVSQRFDFKGSLSEITLQEGDLVLVSEDEYKLKALSDLLQQRLIKRKVPLKALNAEKPVPAAGSTVRQKISIQQGIPTEKGKEIIKFIKSLKLKKIQASLQGDVVRVSGRDRDALQEVIQELKKQNFGIEIQFTNYRSS